MVRSSKCRRLAADGFTQRPWRIRFNILWTLVCVLAWTPNYSLARNAQETSRSSAARDLERSGGAAAPTTPSVLTVYETETYDGAKQEWIGNLPSRWTQPSFADPSTESSCDPPSKKKPPAGLEFHGDWKIVTSYTRDKLGWEYRRNEPPIRRRTWLRTLSPVVLKQTPVTSRRASPRRSLVSPYTGPIVAAWQLLRDDFNFKGFGWSFYKSFLFRESFGLAFRVPLTLNFDFMERHPELPSISSSFALYYPYTVAAFLSASLNVDYLKWCLRFGGAQVRRLLVLTVVALMRGILRVMSLLLYPVTQKEFVVPPPMWPLALSIPPPSYQLDISERIGMSLSWRVSRKRGYEMRVSYWHSFLPTFLYTQQVIQKSLRLGTLSQQQKGKDWLRRHTGSLGLSTGGPTPDPPHYSCSACLSLSGFHYQRESTSRATARSQGDALADPPVPDAQRTLGAVTRGESRSASLANWKDEGPATSSVVKVG